MVSPEGVPTESGKLHRELSDSEKVNAKKVDDMMSGEVVADDVFEYVGSSLGDNVEPAEDDEGINRVSSELWHDKEQSAYDYVDRLVDDGDKKGLNDVRRAGRMLVDQIQKESSHGQLEDDKKLRLHSYGDALQVTSEAALVQVSSDEELRVLQEQSDKAEVTWRRLKGASVMSDLPLPVRTRAASAVDKIEKVFPEFAGEVGIGNEELQTTENVGVVLSGDSESTHRNEVVKNKKNLEIEVEKEGEVLEGDIEDGDADDEIIEGESMVKSDDSQESVVQESNQEEVDLGSVETVLAEGVEEYTTVGGGEVGDSGETISTEVVETTSVFDSNDVSGLESKIDQREPLRLRKYKPIRETIDSGDEIYSTYQENRSIALRDIYEGKESLPYGLVADMQKDDYFESARGKQRSGEVLAMIPEKYFDDEKVKKKINELANRLDSGESLKEVINDFKKNKADRKSLLALKLMGIRIVQDRLPDDQSWREMDEESRRALRVGERMIHEAEIGVMEQKDMDIDPKKAALLHSRNQRYQENVDISDEHRERLAEVNVRLEAKFVDLKPREKVEKNVLESESSIEPKVEDDLSVVSRGILESGQGSEISVLQKTDSALSAREVEVRGRLIRKRDGSKASGLELKVRERLLDVKRGKGVDFSDEEYENIRRVLDKFPAGDRRQERARQEMIGVLESELEHADTIRPEAGWVERNISERIERFSARLRFGRGLRMFIPKGGQQDVIKVRASLIKSMRMAMDEEGDDELKEMLSQMADDLELVNISETKEFVPANERAIAKAVNIDAPIVEDDLSKAGELISNEELDKVVEKPPKDYATVHYKVSASRPDGSRYEKRVVGVNKHEVRGRFYKVGFSEVRVKKVKSDASSDNLVA